MHCPECSVLLSFHCSAEYDRPMMYDNTCMVTILTIWNITFAAPQGHVECCVMEICGNNACIMLGHCPGPGKKRTGNFIVLICEDTFSYHKTCNKLRNIHILWFFAEQMLNC